MNTQELLSLSVVAGCGYYLYANKQIDQTQALYAAIFLVVIYFIFIRDYLEGNTNVDNASTNLTETIFAAEDAFTGLDCVDGENLPVFRFRRNPDKTETISCLINPQTNQCFTRQEFFPENTPQCSQMQTALVKGARAEPLKSFLVNLNKEYTLHDCSVKGLQTPGHWCNNVYSTLAKTDCSDKFISGKLKNTCTSLENVSKYLSSADAHPDPVKPTTIKSSGKPCDQQCLAVLNAAGVQRPQINPYTYNCMIPGRGPPRRDPDCEGTKARNKPIHDAYQAVYNPCVSSCTERKQAFGF